MCALLMVTLLNDPIFAGSRDANTQGCITTVATGGNELHAEWKDNLQYETPFDTMKYLSHARIQPEPNYRTRFARSTSESPPNST